MRPHPATTPTPIRRRLLLTISVLGLLFILGLIFQPQLSVARSWVRQQVTRELTVEDRIREFGPPVAKRLAPYFKKAGAPYPPHALTLIGLKQEQSLEVYAPLRGDWRFIRSYRILAASGTMGPKLREGDLQVPEGIYRIDSLNPNSLYHLSLRVSYPNDADHARAKTEGRTNLGGDIMIHGNRVSIGCLAMGDEAAEDLFVLAALVGIENVRVILSPVDFRSAKAPAPPSSAPAWTQTLWAAIQKELSNYPKPTIPRK